MTTPLFKHDASLLIANGYLVIPIKAGEKRPALSNWQSARLTAADAERWPGAGTGVLCGQGEHPVCAFDVDTSNKRLLDLFLPWCDRELGVTCARVGDAPRVLLAFRAADAGWSKASSNGYYDELDPFKTGGKRNVQRLEVLGNGQQFVACAVHPETKRNYAWTDDFGGLLSVPAHELPVISWEQVQAAIAAFEQFAGEAALELDTEGGQLIRDRVDSPPKGSEDLFPIEKQPMTGITAENAADYLDHHDYADRAEWLLVGSCLHHQFVGADDGFAVWDRWSSQWSDYRGTDDVRRTWDSFGLSGRDPKTFRTIMKQRKERIASEAAQKALTLRADARAMIDACTDAVTLVNEIGPACGEAAGDDEGVYLELQALFRARYVELSPGKVALPLTDARRAMRPEKVKSTVAAVAAAGAGVMSRHARTEFGISERLIDAYGEGIMYVPELQVWYCWTGAYWQRSAEVAIEHMIKETIRNLPQEAASLESVADRQELFKFCVEAQKARTVANVMALARSDPRVVVPAAELDKEPMLFGVANGAIDLRTGKLMAPSREHYITLCSSVEYKPGAKSALWEQTLRDVFLGNEEMVAFFQRVVGYAMLGRPDADKIVIPFGCGSNGKSTVMGTVRNAFGSHARYASAGTFMSNAPSAEGGAREDILRLRGARLVYVSEPDENAELKEGLIKSMTGGEAMTARGLYAKSTIEVFPTWVTFIPTNHRPIVRGSDHGIWRRIMSIPFERNFDKDVGAAQIKEVGREARLRSELAGVLRWCVEGALLYQTVGFSEPGEVIQATETYREDMDLLAEWMAECCVLDAQEEASCSALFASWKLFAEGRGELRLVSSSRRLAAKLKTKGFWTKGGAGNVKMMVGISVKSGADDDSL